MARQKRISDWNPVPVEWIDTWWAHLESAPFQLEVSVDLSLDPVTEVVVVLLPCDRLRQQHPIDEPNYYRDEYEVTGTLFREVPSIPNALRLKAALSIVRWLQGLEPREGLAFIVFLFLVFTDMVAANHGRPPLLKRPTWGESGIPQTKRAAYFAKHLRRPAFRLKDLLYFWDLFGAHCARGLRLGPQGNPGRMRYLVIPPQWQGFEDLQRANASDCRIEVPVLVKPQFASVVSNFAGLYEQQMALGGSLSLRLAPNPPVMELGAPARDVFRWDGEHWRITWEGTELPRVPKRTGLYLIHFLMKHEGEQFPVLDLLTQTLDKGKASGGVNPAPRSSVADGDAQVGFRVTKLLEPAIERGDPDAYKSLRRELERLEALKEVQEESGGQASDNLNSQIQQVRRRLSADFGVGGQPHWDAPIHHKGLVRVDKALKVARARLRMHCPDLATHFENAIRKEHGSYSYRPDRKIDWSL